MIAETDSSLKSRRNYHHANAMNYDDGDSTSGVTYGYGITSLISDKSRVYKGGSWDDRAYWLSPGTRRYLEEDQSSRSLGFRCAMSHYGSAEGLSTKDQTGTFFPARRNKR